MAGIGKKIKRGKTVASMFSFYGRTSRLGWLSCNIAGGMLIAPFFVGLQIGDAQFTAMALVLAVPGMVIALASHARRLRDIGLSGWLMVMGLIPFASTLMMFVYLLIPGSRPAEQTSAAPST